MSNPEASAGSESKQAKVPPTARGVAYLRTFSDIPYAPELFDEIDKRQKAAGGPDIASRMKRDLLAPQLEARYKLVNKLLLESGLTQVIELAAGLAPRGVELTRAHPDIRYVEFDLPEMAQEKRDILAGINVPLPPNLKIEGGNALLPADVARAVAGFSKDQPLAVVNEGLMRYLTFDEKTALAHTVHGLLSQFGGAWITPDISLRAALDRENDAAAGHIRNLTSMTGIDIDKNVFEDEAHARNFFEDLGFSIERHDFLEVTDDLVSPAKLRMSREEVERLNAPCVAFIMHLA